MRNLNNRPRKSLGYRTPNGYIMNLHKTDINLLNVGTVGYSLSPFFPTSWGSHSRNGVRTLHNSFRMPLVRQNTKYNNKTEIQSVALVFLICEVRKFR
jgi:hypothetical protein